MNSITNKQLFDLLTVEVPDNKIKNNLDMGSFVDSQDDDLTKMKVSGSRELDNFFNQSSNTVSNRNTTKNEVSTIPKPFLSDLSRIEMPLYMQDSFFCCIACSLSPELLGSSQTEQIRRLSDIRKRLALDLDEKNMFKKFNYVRKFRKGDIQNQLFSSDRLEGIWQYYYFTDYFNINVLLFVEGYAMYCGKYKEGRPYIILGKQNGRYVLYTSSSGEALLTHDYMETKIPEIQEHFRGPCPTFQKISNYKKSDLDELAKYLNISIQSLKNKKSKNRLYNEIHDKLIC